MQLLPQCFSVLWHTGQQSSEGWERSKNEQSERKQLLDEEHTQQPVETERAHGLKFTTQVKHVSGITEEGGWTENSSA